MENKTLIENSAIKMPADGYAIGIIRKIKGMGRDLYFFVPEEELFDEKRAIELTTRLFKLIKEWENGNRNHTKK